MCRTYKEEITASEHNNDPLIYVEVVKNVGKGREKRTNAAGGNVYVYIHVHVHPHVLVHAHVHNALDPGKGVERCLVFTASVKVACDDFFSFYFTQGLQNKREKKI